MVVSEYYEGGMGTTRYRGQIGIKIGTIACEKKKNARAELR
jgi:hypothetical protein